MADVTPGVYLDAARRYCADAVPFDEYVECTAEDPLFRAAVDDVWAAAFAAGQAAVTTELAEVREALAEAIQQIAEVGKAGSALLAEKEMELAERDLELGKWAEGEMTTEHGLINENTREFVPFDSWTEACAFAQGRQVMRRTVWRGQVFEAREGAKAVDLS